MILKNSAKIWRNKFFFAQNTSCLCTKLGTTVAFKEKRQYLVQKLAFFVQNTANFCKIRITTLVFKKNGDFFAENWQISPKIVIITLTPDRPCLRL
jgi:hypothetical protein